MHITKVLLKMDLATSILYCQPTYSSRFDGPCKKMFEQMESYNATYFEPEGVSEIALNWVSTLNSVYSQRSVQEIHHC